MSVFALADFHLSFGVRNKSMEIFGSEWRGWTEKIKRNCEEKIGENDLLLIAGDISWASTLEEAMQDLLWISHLPGTKILIKGNHDYWWPSYAKLLKALPPSILAIQNNSFVWNDIGIAGTRLWDSPEFSFKELYSEPGSFGQEEVKPFTEEDQKIFDRECLRLEMSLNTLPKDLSKKIVMTHYPPIGYDLKSSRVSKILKEQKVDIAVFGHLHSLKTTKKLFGEREGTFYSLTSCDFLDFEPLKLL